MLPVINRECVAQAVRTGLGLKAKINLRSRFDRKNYFYPDLPQGYQISQYKQPIVGEGDGDGRPRRRRDAFASASSGCTSSRTPASRCTTSTRRMSFVDLNRSGVALMEIVSRPDLRSAEEARAFLTKLRSILRYLGTCDGDMEKGNLRADVNVSVRRPGEPLGTRCEIKNVNSIRFVGQAIEHEARRQIAVIEDGGTIEQETRLFDPAKGETRSDAHQGRGARLPLFPRPRPPAARARPGLGRRARARRCPNCPTRRRRASSATMASAPTTPTCSSPRRETADFFEAVAKGRDRQGRRQLGDQRARRPPQSRGQGDRRQSRYRPAQLGAIIDLIADGAISGKIAKDVFEIVWSEGGDPAAIVESARPEAGHRHRRDREDRRRDHRRQSRQGGRRPRRSRRCSAGSSAR